jgi:ABC-type multidrug transport system ATPase subunit
VGVIQLNGLTVDSSSQREHLRRLSAYTEQEIPLIGSLSIRETLEFAHRLAVPPSKGGAERHVLISNLLRDLALTGAMEHKRIGSALGGDPRLSSGEKKRLGIATQLVTKPAILLLDEPTSGLDSSTALEVMLKLRDIARTQGMIILASIHQPSKAVFQTFDDLLLLHRSGRQIFSGPIEDSVSLIRHMGSTSTLDENPAEQLLRVATQPSCVVSAPNISWPSPQTSNSGARVRLKKKLHTVHRSSTLYILVHRAFFKAFRDATAYAIRAVMYLGLALLVGTIWLRLDPTDRNVQSLINAMFFGGAFMSFMAVAYVPAYLEDRAVFAKERADGLYGPSLFVLANFLVGLPFLLSFSLLFTSVAYWLCNFRPSLVGYCTWVLWLFLDLAAAESLVVLVSSAVPVFVASLAVTAFWNGIWMCTGGFMVHGNTLNPFWRYTFHYIDYQAYVFQGMMVNEFARRTYSCATRTDEDTKCSCVYETLPTEECSVSGRHILQLYDIKVDGFTTRLAAMLAIITVLRVLAWFVLRIRKSGR